MEKFIPEASEESIKALRKLSPDALREIIGKADWKTAISLCQVFRGACTEGFWRERTKREFGEGSWLVTYKYPFHSYLAARVRYLKKELENLSLSSSQSDRFVSGDRLTPEDVGLGGRIQIPGRSAASYLSKALEFINSYEVGHGRAELILPPNSNKLDLVRLLNSYFEPYHQKNREIKRRTKEMEDESIQISLFLARYLKRTAPEIFRREEIFLTREEAIEYFSQTEKILSRPRGNFRMNEKGVLSEEQTRTFLFYHPLLPDTLGELTSSAAFKRGDETPAGYVFLVRNHLLYFRYFSERDFAEAFIDRMLELGILSGNYHILYPISTSSLDVEMGYKR